MAVGNALMDMYKEMQAELNQKQGKEPMKPKKAPKPKAVTPVEETDKMYCPECGEPRAAISARAADGANAIKRKQQL